MSIELSARFAEQNYCRLCLSSIYELHALFPKVPNESNAILISKISLLAEIILIPTEELNAKICSRCKQQLEEFDSFRRRCKDIDSQIRKIRTMKMLRDQDTTPVSEISAAGNNTQSLRSEQIKFGGAFDLMQYSECCPEAPGEYYMLSDGYVYRKENLLLWRCELATCQCQLLFKTYVNKFLIYANHNHPKPSIDQRNFHKLDQRVYAFLNKLRNQMNSTQNSTPGAQQTCPPNSKSTEIQYSTEGDRPSIIVDCHKYYKEAVNDDVTPSLIHWRCNDKHCLGMIKTTANLGSYQVYKDHNHVPKPVTVKSISLFPLRVAALPMNDPQPSTSAKDPNQSSIAGANMSRPNSAHLATTPIISNRNETSESQNLDIRVNAPVQINVTNTIVKATPVTLTKNPSLMTFYKNATNYYMYQSRFFYYREVCNSSLDCSEILWKCFTTKCPSTVIVFKNHKFVPGPGHNHEPFNWQIRNLTLVSSAEALTKPIIVSEISFYRFSNTKGICLLYKQFTYSILPSPWTDAINWKCRNEGCAGQLRSGIQFEYLTIVKFHNHGPGLDLTIDVENNMAVSDALKELKEKAQKQVKPNCPQPKGNIDKRNAAEACLRLKRNAAKQRRMAARC